MATDWLTVVAGVIVALAFVLLAGYVVGKLSPQTPARGIAYVLAALASLFAALPAILRALQGS
jgi:flagellar biogenesis protein FliO